MTVLKQYNGSSWQPVAVGAQGIQGTTGSGAQGIQGTTGSAGGPGNLAQITTGTLSGTSVNITGLSSYSDIWIQIYRPTYSGSQANYVGINGDTTAANYKSMTIESHGSTQGGFYRAIWAGFGAIDQYSITNTFLSMVHFSNTKTTGFTSANWLEYSSYGGVDYVGSGFGIYVVSSAVSSLQITGDQALTYTGGTYTVWGA